MCVGKGRVNQSCPNKCCPLCCPLQESCKVPSHQKATQKSVAGDGLSDRCAKRVRLDLPTIIQERPVKIILTDFELADIRVGHRGITVSYALDLVNTTTYCQGAEYVLPRVPVASHIERNMKGNVITNSVLKEAASCGQTVPEQDMFTRYINYSSCLKGVTVFVAYNCCVERNAIMEAIEVHSCTSKDQIVLFVDTLRIVRDRLPRLESHSFGTVYKELFNRAMSDEHRAKGDVDGLLSILSHSLVRGDQSVQDMLLQYAGLVAEGNVFVLDE